RVPAETPLDTGSGHVRRLVHAVSEAVRDGRRDPVTRPIELPFKAESPVVFVPRLLRVHVHGAAVDDDTPVALGQNRSHHSECADGHDHPQSLSDHAALEAMRVPGNGNRGLASEIRQAVKRSDEPRADLGHTAHNVYYVQLWIGVRPRLGTPLAVVEEIQVRRDSDSVVGHELRRALYRPGAE